MMLVRLALATLSLLAGLACAQAQETQWRHATALTGEPRYAPGFAHFDYVNPQAPKGGRVRLGSEGGFDSFNPILPADNKAPGIAYLNESLMTSSYDELDISAEYGLLAEAMKYPPDFSSVTYRLRPEARWHDGQPVTAADVVWSFDQTVKNNPYQRNYYSHVVKAEQTGEREVTFTFDAPGNRELPHIMGQLTVLPQHWWEGKDAQGRQRDISKTTLEPPLGSGPYRIKSFQANRFVSYARVPDYWGKDLNVNVGAYNLDEIRFDEYRDSTVLLEAFKGDQYDWRVENSAKNWATGYHFPARDQKKVIIEEFPDKASGAMQAFVPNLRLPKFSDERVRLALNYAFNFEALKESIFFGQYQRINSFFFGTELASSGVPSGRELEILQTVKDKVPPELFTTPYTNPVSDTPEAARNNLRQALALMKQAGYELRGRQLVNSKTGEPFTIEVLEFDPLTERYLLPYQQDLAKIGIEMRIRSVDTPQYIERVQKRQFDMIVQRWGQSLSPGNEQRAFWGSAAADQPNSPNYAGIKDPAVDALIDKVIFATTREDLVAATRALDRVLLWRHYVIPQWDTNVTRTARWDRFGRPPNIPPYTTGFPDIWWWDAERAQKVAAR
jgi:microcin C transport system substrate-binding protein